MAKTAGLVLVQIVMWASPSQAETLTVSPVPSSTPPARDWTVSFAVETYVLQVPLPLLGVEVAYHPIDRLAFAGRLTTLLIAVDLSAEVRYFLIPVQPRSGLYAAIAGHYLGALMGGAGAGGSIELGYEKQTRSGVNVGASAGASLLPELDSCGCGPHATQRPWAPIVNLRMGKSF